MLLRQLYDQESSTYTYLIADEATREAALIDPVKEQVARDLKLIQELGLKLVYSIDTHVHADHITGSGDLVTQTGAESVAAHGGAPCATRHVGQGDVLPLGSLRIEVLSTPGHTDDSLSYRVGNAVFTGDALLIRGCGRTDFQNGDPQALYRSITEVLFTLPGDTVVYPGHDYRGLSVSTIDEERQHNPRLSGKTQDEFVSLMTELKLAPPTRINEAVPANRVCGRTMMGFDGAPKASSGYFQLQAEALLRQAAAPRIVDVREPPEFTGELGHITGAELVPMADVQGAAQGWPKAEPLVLVCHSGRRSATAAAHLVALGFEQVANLEGGMLAYNRAAASATPA